MLSSDNDQFVLDLAITVIRFAELRRFATRILLFRCSFLEYWYLNEAKPNDVVSISHGCVEGKRKRGASRSCSFPYMEGVGRPWESRLYRWLAGHSEGVSDHLVGQ